jgi:hypothetical protein
MIDTKTALQHNPLEITIGNGIADVEENHIKMTAFG